MDGVKVAISNRQKAVKIPTGIRLLVRRCCSAVLTQEEFQTKMNDYTEKLTELFAEGNALQAEILEQLKKVKYE